MVRNGIDVERFCPNKAARDRLRRELEVGDKFVWLAAGRLRQQKDYPNLLRAFAGLGGGLLLVSPVKANFVHQLEQLAAELLK